jgi:RHS repeat-associated protein
VPDVVEGFHYDALNRLDYVTRSAGGAATTTMDLSYDPDGNIKTKAGVDNNIGTYNYATSGTGAGPHAVSNITGGTAGAAGTFHYDSAGNLDCRMGWNGTGCSANSGTTWFSFNLPQRINYSGNGGSYADFSYGPSRELVRQTVVTTTPAANKTTYYIGPHFEVEVENDVAVRYRSNVFFGERLVYSQIDKVSVPADLQQYYIHQDYQGSVDRVSLAGGSSFGGSTQFSFDAFGKRRETSWLNDADNSTFGDNHWLERGYTGHEMLDNVRMIHMNGRVQDPVWGRMLSPDPMLGDLTLPQSLNPYSYVSNNPATLVDPTGYAGVGVEGAGWKWDPPIIIAPSFSYGGGILGFHEPGAMESQLTEFLSATERAEAERGAESEPEGKMSKIGDPMRVKRCTAAAQRLGRAAGTMAAFTVMGAQAGDPPLGLAVGVSVAALDDMFGGAPLSGDIGASIVDGGSPSGIVGQQFGNAIDRLFGTSYPGIGRIGQDVGSNLVVNTLRGGNLAGSARAIRFGVGASAAYFAAFFAVEKLAYSHCMKD